MRRSPPLKKDYQIALVCSGITHVQRGFETFVADLAFTFNDCPNIYLFQGSGPRRSRNATILPTLKRNSWEMRWFARHSQSKRYRFEQLSFTLSGWMLRYWPKYDLIYYCDSVIGSALYRLRETFGYSYRLLYGNCMPSTPDGCQRCDYIQQFSATILQEAIEAKIPRSKMTLLPMGIDVRQFETTLCRETLRQKYHVPRDKFVILAVSSLDDKFKRIPWLIETIAEMHDPNLHLLLVGQNENTNYAKQTLSLADRRLLGQYQHLTIPHSAVAEIYRASDLFIHPALQEGFGKVYLEAAGSELPVLCHDSAHTQWLVADELSRIDMECRASLQNRIRELQTNPSLRQQTARRNYCHVVKHFAWYTLKYEYLQMFEAALA